MPPVTGEPQHGDKEAADVASHEEGRPPDEIYEDDKMETSSRRFPPASVSKSTKISDEDSEQLGPLAPQKEKRKGIRKLNSEDIYPHYPQSEAQETMDEKTAVVSDAADTLSLGPSDITEPHHDSWADSTAAFLALDEMEIGKEKYPIRESGKLKHIFQEQRAWLVHGIWASIKNVRKIPSSLSVNKRQCEHIADHFEVIGDVLKKLGLGKDLVSGQALESGTGIQTVLSFDEALFDHIADTFDSERHSYFRTTRSEDLSREFLEYILELDGQVGSSKDSLIFKKLNIFKGSEGSQNYTLQRMSVKEIFETRFGYQMQHRLDGFLYLLFEVLKYGEALVLFHLGFEGANNGVVKRTGLYGEKFVQIHEFLYKLLDCYACLEHCEDTEFARGHWYAEDSCRAQSLLYYLNSNCLGESASLSIDDNSLNVELATTLSELLERPNCVLKTLHITPSSMFKINREELRKCLLLVIAALSKCVSMTSLTVHASNGEEVHELCKSLRANRVLKHLDISIDGPLNDDQAMAVSAMLKENHSLKSFTLDFKGISSEGAAYLGALLTGKHKVILSVVDFRPFSEILFKGQGLPTGESRYTQKLHVSSKTLTCVSINLRNLDPDAIFEILDSLKKSKTLQVLELESWPWYGRNHGANREVAACLEALLAENSTIEELKVQIGAWDKCFVQHLLRPLMAEKDGEPHVNISLRQLHIMISHVELSPHECGEVVESITQLLRTNKTLTHFFMNNAFLRTPDICDILDSLKTNKALQVLNFDKRFDYRQAKIAFVDLLVNYNFTLSMIRVYGWDMDIENFMKSVLEFDTEMTLREVRSLIGTTSESPIVRSADDLKQAVETLQPKKGEGSIEEMCGSSKRAFDKDKSKVEAKDKRPQIFLSYSKEMINFARLLCKELKSSNYNVFDQDSINFAEVVDQCQLAIVILSDKYVNECEPSMFELCTIVKSKRTNNPTLKVFPLFYKLTVCDLQGIFLDTVLEKEALNFLCEGKNEVLRKANDLVHSLSQGEVIDVGKFCEEFSELQRNSWPSNGLEFEKNTISEEGYLHAILEEIFHYMPIVECNNNQTSRHQSKLEMESKLSLQQMNPLMESLPTTSFYLQRKFNMAKYLQEKYIQYSSFEEMCPLSLSPIQKQEYNKGRIAAALFPMTFLYHLKMQMIQGPRVGNFRPMLKASADFVVEKMQNKCNENGADFVVEKMQNKCNENGADFVVEKMQNKCNENGVQTSTFFDFVDFGAPVDPKRIIAMCQNFPTKTSNASEQLVIVQDDLTGAYYYQCIEAPSLENPTIDKLFGVIGVQVTSTEVYVDNIQKDGSSYSGLLGDFSYQFDSDENNQCAAKAFGDLKGATFLLKNNGIKCSPLLIVALASAIQKKGLILTWSNGKGHMEFYPKLALKSNVEVEACACQIQYIGDINQLGIEIEWGTDTNSCALHNQTSQSGTNEILNQQVLGSNVDQNVATTSSSVASGDCVSSIQNQIAFFNALGQQKEKISVGISAVGSGIEISYEKYEPETKKAMDNLSQDIRRQQYASQGEFCRIPNLEIDYPNLVDRLLRCQLHEVHDHNYLVVYNFEARHISIYDAIERYEGVPKFNLTWISDIHIDGGEKQIRQIFDIGLKGRELTVKREGIDFVKLEVPSKALKKIVPRYQELLLELKKTFLSDDFSKSMGPIPEQNLARMLKSKNEWVHIIGPRADYEASYKYWWNATFMEAIVYSRTMYTSGTLLKTRIELAFNAIPHIGCCDVQEGCMKFKHQYGSVVSRGKFSRPPTSLLSKKVLWGGLEIVLEN